MGRADIKGVPAANVETANLVAIKKSYESELLLELLANYEWKRGLINAGQDPARAEPRIQAVERELTPEGEPMATKPRMKIGKDAHPYIESYNQWYALVIYGIREDSRPWSKGGAARNLLAEIEATTAKWSESGTGPNHIDGSVVASALYAAELLYINNKWCAGDVGVALNTPVDMPPDNPKHPFKDPNQRNTVILLDRATKFVESCYKGPVPLTLGLRYSTGMEEKPNDPGAGEKSSLVGGKLLYLIAKRAVAYEQGHAYDEEKYRLELLNLLRALSERAKLQLERKIGAGPRASSAIPIDISSS